MTKDQIRREKKLQRSLLDPKEKSEFEKAIRNQLFQTMEYQNSSQLFTYVSFGSEVDTTLIIRRAFTDGKEVYVPRVSGKSMEFIKIHDMESFKVSKFGVPEPEDRPEHRFYLIPDKSYPTRPLMLLPGLAFDFAGNRIGYGAGYYDCYLSLYPPDFFYKLALAYDFQLIEDIPTDAFDQKADEIVTPTHRVHCKGIRH